MVGYGHIVRVGRSVAKVGVSQPVGLERVSVVMGVYNAEKELMLTLDSLQAQQSDPLEIIVVNDGSIDGTAELLEQWQRKDSSHRVLQQDHQGLTAALVSGCAAARGDYIARQDAGDVSLPERLTSEAAVLDEDESVVMVSTGARFVDAKGVPLYDVVMAGNSAMTGLEANRASEVKGPPHHGNVMFRRDAYIAAGGYRKAFYVAQDIDLWLRLVERGRHVSLGQVLYRAHSSPSSISFNRRSAQREATHLALLARDCRLRGESEASVLGKTHEATRKRGRSGRRSLAEYHFFVAGCQRQNHPGTALRHYRQALAANPVHWRAFLRWLQCQFSQFNRPSAVK